MYHLIPNILKSPLSNIFALVKSLGKLTIKGYGTLISPDCKFQKNVTIYGGCEILSSSFGRMTYVGHGSRIGHAKIGNYCSISQNVIIGPGKHPTSDFFSTHPAFFSTRKQSGKTYVKKNIFNEFDRTIIGNDVMIGARAIILDGITVSDGAIIAAGAVVTKNVPPYAVVGGVPAKVIKYRFSIPAIKYLLSLGWWNMDEQHLLKNIQEINRQVKLLDKSKK